MMSDKLSGEGAAPLADFHWRISGASGANGACGDAVRHCHCLVGSGAAAAHRGFSPVAQNPVAQIGRN